MFVQNVRENDILFEYYFVYLLNGIFISQKNILFKELEKYLNKRSFVLIILKTIYRVKYLDLKNVSVFWYVYVLWDMLYGRCMF